MDASGLGTIAVGSVSELANILSNMTPEQLQSVRLDPALYNALSQTIESTPSQDVYNYTSVDESVTNQMITPSTNQSGFVTDGIMDGMLNQPVNVNTMAELGVTNHQYVTPTNADEFLQQQQQQQQQQDFMSTATQLSGAVQQHIITQPIQHSNQIVTLGNTEQVFVTSNNHIGNNTQVMNMNESHEESLPMLPSNQQLLIDNTGLLNTQISNIITNSNNQVITQPLLVTSSDVQSLFMAPINTNTLQFSENQNISQQSILVADNSVTQSVLMQEPLRNSFASNQLTVHNLPQIHGILPGQASSLIITPTAMSQVQPTATVQTLNLTETQVLQAPLSEALHGSVPTSAQSFLNPFYSPIVTSVYPSSININPSLLANSNINHTSNLNQTATIVNTVPNQQLIFNGNTIIGSVVSTTTPQQILLPSLVDSNQLIVNNGQSIAFPPTETTTQPAERQQIMMSSLPQQSIYLPAQTSVPYDPQLPILSNTLQTTSKPKVERTKVKKVIVQPQLKINPLTGTATITLQNGVQVELNPEQVQNVLLGKQVVASGRRNTTSQKSTSVNTSSTNQPKTKTIVKTVNVISRSEAQVQMIPKSVEQVQPGVFKFQLKQVDQNNPIEASKSITVNQPVTITKTFQTVSKEIDSKTPKPMSSFKSSKFSSVTPPGAFNAAEIRRNIISPTSILKSHKVSIQSNVKSSSTAVLSSSPQISQLAKDQLLALAKKINNSAQLSKNVNSKNLSKVSKQPSEAVQTPSMKSKTLSCDSKVDFAVSKSSSVLKSNKFKLQFPGTLRNSASKIVVKSGEIDSAKTVKSDVVMHRIISGKPTRVNNIVTAISSDRSKTDNPAQSKISSITTVMPVKPTYKTGSSSSFNVNKTNLSSAADLSSSKNETITKSMTDSIPIKTDKEKQNSIDEDAASLIEQALECNEQGFKSPTPKSNEALSGDTELQQKKAAIFSKSFKKPSVLLENTVKAGDKTSSLSKEESEILSFRNTIQSCKTDNGNTMKRQLELEIENQRKRINSSKSSKEKSNVKSPTSTTGKKSVSSKDNKSVMGNKKLSPTEEINKKKSAEEESSNKSITTSGTKTIAESKHNPVKKNPSSKTNISKSKSTIEDFNSKSDEDQMEFRNKSEETRKRERPKRFDDFVFPTKPKKEKKSRKFFFPKDHSAMADENDDQFKYPEDENTTNDVDSVNQITSESSSNVDLKIPTASEQDVDNSDDTPIPTKKPKQSGRGKPSDETSDSVVDADKQVEGETTNTTDDISEQVNEKETDPDKNPVQNNKDTKTVINTTNKKIKKRKKKTQISVELEVLPEHLKTKSKLKKVEDSVIDLRKVKLKSGFAENTYILNESIDQKTYKLLTKTKWVCTLCGKPGNIGTLDVLFGPYKLKVDCRNENKNLIMDIWLHRDCAIWTSSVCLSNQTLVGLSEALESAAKTLCCLCSQVGATLECGFKQCRDGYHFVCAKQRGCSFKMENFTITCPKHK